VFPVCPPFRLRVSQHRGHTFLLDDTRPPWVTHLSSPPCRPHTPWYDEVEPSCLRLHSAGSTIPHLWPTGSSWGCLPSITTRWFSASPADPASRRAPCPPESCMRWLQVPLGCVRLSPVCPCRVLHTCLSPAGEALPPPLDINLGSQVEWDFNPPDTCAARHTLCPLLTSAERSGRIAPPSVLNEDTPQISRGKLSYRRCIDAGFIKHNPIVDGGLHGRVPARPDCATPRIRFVSLAPHLRSTLPSDPTSR
jgi:hypothetical protein